MRGFSKKPTRPVSFSDGEETITYTVYPLPALFMPMVRDALPYDGESRTVLNARSLIMIAEGLRPGEELPPHPDPAADTAAWMTYAASLSEVFYNAGLTTEQIRKLGETVSQLDEFQSEALEEAGNG